MSTTVDIANAANILLGLAAAAITTAIPVVVPALLKRLGVANDTDLKNNLENVLQAAAGGAYKFAASHEGGLSNVAVHNGALATATSYVVSNLPDTLQKLGITPDKVTAMVSARLGTLLATDPTVTAGKPPVALPMATPAPVVLAPIPTSAPTVGT